MKPLLVIDKFFHPIIIIKLTDGGCDQTVEKNTQFIVTDSRNKCTLTYTILLLNRVLIENRPIFSAY